MNDFVKVQQFPAGIEDAEFDEILAGNKILVVEMFTNYGSVDWFGIWEPLNVEEFSTIHVISTDFAEAHWLVQRYDIEEKEHDPDPALLFFKDGKLVGKHIGFMENDDLLAKLRELIG